MKALKYIIGIGIMVLLFSGCDDVDDMPPRLVDMTTSFVMPATPRLTIAERDIIQARKDAYTKALEDN